MEYKQVAQHRHINSLTKLLSVSVLAALLAACGGSGGASDSKTGASADPNAAQVTGNVMKGAVSHGVVTAYSIVDGQKGELLATGLTDANGHYRLQIPSSYSGPVKIEVRGGSDATMVCDAADGCGDAASIPSFDTNRNGKIDFGETFPLDSDFELDAAVPSVTGGTTVTAAVTTITHLATNYAEHISGGLNAQSIATANSQAANMFAVSGNILSLTPPNLANSESIAGANSSSVHYAVISAAILGVVDRENLGAKLNELAQTFASLNGQLYQNHALDNSISLDDIAEQAFVLADKLNLNDSRNKAARLLQVARRASSSSLTIAEASPTSNAAPIDKAKQFVADINTWNGILNFKHNDNLFSAHQIQMQQNLVPVMAGMQQTLAGVSTWGLVPALPELAIATFCNSLQGVSKTLCNSVISTDEISRACVGGSGLTLFGQDLCTVLKKVTLVKNSNYSVVYNMLDGTVAAKGLVNGNAVDLTMMANTSTSGKRLSFSIAGTLDNDSAHLALESSTINFDFTDAIDLLKLKAPATASAEFIGSLAQKASDTVTDPVSFKGHLNLDVDLSALSGGQVSGEQLVQNVLSTLSSHNLNFTLLLSGAMSSLTGDELNTDLSVHGGTTNTYSLGYEIKSADLTSTAYATVSGTIDQTEMKPVSLELSYAGRTITVSNDANNLNYFSLLNQDGVTLDFNVDPTATGNVGSAALDNQTLASIRHQDSAYVVDFMDSTTAPLNF